MSDSPSRRFDEPVRSARAPQPEAEVDLAPYLRGLWRARVWIVAVGGVCAGMMLAWGLSQARGYESTLVLQVTSSRASEGAGPASPATMRPIIESRTLAAEVVRAVGLDRPPHAMSPSDMLRALTVEEVRGTNLLRLRFRLSDPSLAAKALNALGEVAVTTARRLGQAEAVRARDRLETHIKDAQQRLTEAETRLKQARTAAQVDVVKADVKDLLRQRSELTWLELEIRGERAKVAAGEAELKRREPRLQLKRSLDRSPALTKALGNAVSAESVADLQVTDEYVSPVYEEIDRVLAESRTTLAGLERQRDRLVDELRLNGKALPQIAQLAQAEVAQERAETEYEIAKKVFEDVATRYESARVQVDERSSQLQVIDQAVPSEQPLPRGAVRNAILVFVAAAGLAALTVLLVSAIRVLAADARATY